MEEIIQEQGETTENALHGETAAEGKGFSLESMDTWLQRISKISEKAATEVREMRRLYHNEFSGRLQSMQKELEYYHELEKGRAYDTILSEVARMYCDNYGVVEKIEDEKVRKQLRYMFLDILELLESYGVSKQESSIGDKRNTKFCQVLERVPTEQPEQHDTVAASKSAGFYIENRPLIKELVNVFVYAEKNKDEEEKEV